jgi:TetR/AcrR family transcriptional repressor of mexJK operon
MTSTARKTTLAMREEILRAARDHFAHYGFTKATMDEIAGVVGLGKASLYYYFPAKEQLLVAVMVHEHEEFLRHIQEITRGELPAAEKIRVYVRERFAYFGTLLNLSILELRDSSKSKPCLTQAFAELTRRELKVLRSIIDDGNAEGEFEAHPEEKVAAAFLHVLQGLRCRFVRSNPGPKYDVKEYDRLRQEISFVTDLLLAGIEPRVQSRLQRRPHIPTRKISA